MDGKRVGRDGEGWVARLQPRCEDFEQAVLDASGRQAVIVCDGPNDRLLVLLDVPHPSLLDVVADTLASLWPGFLAPAGVSLAVVDGDEWDHESMALRGHSQNGRPAAEAG